MKNQYITLLIFSLLSCTAHAKVTVQDALNDAKYYANAVHGTSEADALANWNKNKRPPNKDDSGELETSTKQNGYVILNKSTGLINQWGRLNLPADKLGSYRVKFSRPMSETFKINVSESDAYTSSGCRDCTIETGAYIKSIDRNGFYVTNGFVGDSRGGVYPVTIYWNAMGKL
ncbi:hypothetical protein [Photobacterium leiognathi]|uniref:Uncharacterized protein n=1 Tax=Photobacterium leiognathi lrivu.4.1 TaxID=1248232 RepID=V5H2Q6_PHOLE|nr:hypothetical protein [Photobacterium leiognathi]GAD31362.1 hypothetical protein PLEI_3020 [Photobacterium leiognathi lrivu.4.1]